MPKAGQLKSTIARALHLPERSVDYPYRVALEHGEVSKGKRGRGGASITEADSAKALIAVAGSYMGGEVIQRIRDFSRLQLSYTAHYTANQGDAAAKSYAADGWIETEDGPILIECKITQLQSLPSRHTFADALTALIEAARDRALGNFNKIEVIFYGPEPKVGIEIASNVGTDRYVEEALYLLPNPPEVIAAEEKASAFEVTVKIDHRPLFAIADLFRYDGHDDLGHPLDPNHPWNKQGSPEAQIKRRAEIEEYIDRRDQVGSSSGAEAS